MASLSYVYRQGELDVTRRLSTLQHDHHDLVVSSTMVPLDHEFRLETLMLRAGTALVRQFADLLCAQRCVRHGKLNLISMDAQAAAPWLARAPRHEEGHSLRRTAPAPAAGALSGSSCACRGRVRRSGTTGAAKLSTSRPT